MYGKWAYSSTFLRFWAFNWKLESRYGSQIRIKVKGRRFWIRIKVTSRIRVRIKVIRIRNTAYYLHQWLRHLVLCPAARCPDPPPGRIPPRGPTGCSRQLTGSWCSARPPCAGAAPRSAGSAAEGWMRPRSAWRPLCAPYDRREFKKLVYMLHSA